MEEFAVIVETTQTVALPFTTSQVSPPFGLAVAPVVGGGTFAAGNYFWEVTALTALGETTVSNEATTAIALNGSANLTWNLPHAVITGIKVYRGTVSGAENVLVATLGPAAVAFTDTNVGGAGAPPGTNTATISDYVLLTGAGYFRGYTIAETTGTAAAFLEIQDSSITLAEVRIPQGQFAQEGPYTRGVQLWGRINVHVNSGAARGTVWVDIPC